MFHTPVLPIANHRGGGSSRSRLLAGTGLGLFGTGGSRGSLAHLRRQVSDADLVDFSGYDADAIGHDLTVMAAASPVGADRTQGSAPLSKSSAIFPS